MLMGLDQTHSRRRGATGWRSLWYSQASAAPKICDVSGFPSAMEMCPPRDTSCIHFAESQRILAEICNSPTTGAVQKMIKPDSWAAAPVLATTTPEVTGRVSTGVSGRPGTPSTDVDTPARV